MDILVTIQAGTLLHPENETNDPVILERDTEDKRELAFTDINSMSPAELANMMYHIHSVVEDVIRENDPA